MDRITKIILCFLLLVSTTLADQKVLQPVTYATGSSLTIQSGVHVTGAAGSIWDFTGATVTGLSGSGGAGTVTEVTATAPLHVATGTTTPALTIDVSTGSVPGSMSAADKTKLDAITGTNTGDQTLPVVSDVAYDATTWNGNLDAPSKNAVRDKLESLSVGGDMFKADNLSGLANYTTARSNLGLGTLATQSGTFSGTSSGTNTGDQTITLTGDVTGSGTGSFAASIANSAVTLAKMANMATSSLIYRKTAGSGAPEVNTLATLKTDLGLTGTNSGDQVVPVNQIGASNSFFTAYDSGTGLFSVAQPSFSNISGNATVAQGGTNITSYAVGDLIYASGATTLSKLADVATGNVLLSGGVTTAPAYGKVTTAHTTGIAASGANTDITSEALTLASTSRITDAGTTTTVLPWKIAHDSSGTPAATFGVGLKFQLASSTTADQDAAQISAVWTTATHASRTSKLSFYTVNNAGALAEKATLDGTGTFTTTLGDINAGGSLTSAGNVRAGTSGLFYWNNTGSAIGSMSDGVIRLSNVAATDFSRLQFGGTTSSFPALKRSTTTLQARLADDSDFAAVQTLYDRFGSGSPESAVTAPVGAVFHRTDGGAGTSFYVKESGSGTTGWVAK